MNDPKKLKTLNINLNIGKQLAEMRKNFRGLTNGFSSINFKEIQENFKRFDEGLPDQLSILGEHGWFITGWHTPLTSIYPAAELFRSGNIEEGDRQLTLHFSNILEDVESSLYRIAPERRSILKKAFSAHHNGDHELSIPVFLAQADGIAKDILGVSIYSRRPDLVKKMKDVLDDIGGIWSDSVLLKVALEDLPISASIHSPSYRPGGLNRHEVLHGIDTEYATEVNSWKAISWLQCVAQFKETADYESTEKMV